MLKISIKRLILIVTLVFFSGFALGANFVNLITPKGIRTPAGFLEITPKDLSQLDRNDLVVINVHTPYAGEIPNTNLFINFDEMKANESVLPKDKNAKIVVYCESGNMSKDAAATLVSMGYTNIYNLRGGMKSWVKDGFQLLDLSKLPEKVLPQAGFTLPITWSDFGPKLISLGVIDKSKFESTVNLTDDQKKILEEGSSDAVKIDSQNSQFVVDILWALGLAQKSIVYEEGPMGKEYKSSVGNFSSTGGWTLAQGDAVRHLGMHSLIPLTSDQQKKVAEISKNIFRPCCGNSTWFPDCNHGMAALAAIEVMVSKGISDDEIYKNVLKLNSFWFGQTYLTTATYFERQGKDWNKIDAKEVLGEKYSGGAGAASIAQKVGTLPYGSKPSGGCGA